MPSDTERDDDVDDVDEKKPIGRGGGGGGSGGAKGGVAVAGPGLAPVYLSDASLDRHSMKKGTRVTDIVPFKLLQKADVLKELEELKDQSDFYSLKDQLSEYEGEQLLLIRGPENEFEYNYLWASTTDSFEDHLAECNERARRGGGGADKDKDMGFDQDGDEDDDEDEGRGGKRGKRAAFDKGDDGQEKAAVKRPVEHLSDIEIATLQVKSHRPPLGFYISQSRFKFAKPHDFDDTDPGEKLAAEYRHSKIPHYTTERLVLEAGFQAAPRHQEIATQTFWLNSVNKAQQCAPVLMSEAEREAVLSSPALLSFLSSAEALVTHELQTNETLDVFKDEFREFEDEEVSLGNRLENNLEVFHSFAHFHYSKNKNVNAVQWMPVHHGPTLPPQGRGLGGATSTLVAFSCSNNVTFDQWVDNSGKVQTSSILIYSLSDVLHPWLVLEVPGNVQTFKVHPTHPEYVAAGLATGQVIFWDLSDAREKVRQYQEQQRVNQHAHNRSSGAAGGKPGAAVGPSAGGSGAATAAASAGNADADTSVSGDDVTAIPPIKYTVLSYIDRSHARPVSDIVWLPAHQQLNRKGEFYTADKGVSSQFASVASDGKLLVWDFKNKNDGAAAKASAAAAAAAMSSPVQGSLAARVAAASEDPDAKEPRWAPIFSLPLMRSDAGSGGGGHASSSGGLVTAVKLSVGEGNALMCVTEDGEVVEVDWAARATEERAKPDTIKSIHRAHFASAASVQRSPHFSDIYLTVGDWTFAIWKSGVDFPVFTSPCATEYLTGGRWSPTRPGIIVTARADGSIDVWDLVDQCHKCSLNFQSGFTDALSSLEFWQSRTSSAQFLAAGDSGGKCHIIEVPRNLRRKIANEENLMRLFYEREIARAAYVRRRAEVRKMRAAKEAQMNKGKSTIIAATEDPNNPAAAAPGATGAAAPAPPGSALAAQQARDEKAAEAAAKEKADKLRQLEEEKAEKDFQRMFEQFKQSLAPEDLRKDDAPAAGPSQTPQPFQRK